MDHLYIGTREGIAPTGTGGAENLIKRIIESSDQKAFYLLVNPDSSAEYLEYDPKTSTIKEVSSGPFYKLMAQLYSKHVLSPVGLPLKFRLQFIWLKVIHSKSMTIERILFNYPRNRAKRLVYFFEAILASDKIQCLSTRQMSYVRNLSKTSPRKIKIEKLNIPVPNSFWCDPYTKNREQGFTIAFLGRLDIDKGVEEVAALFRLIREDPRYNLEFHYINSQNKSYENQFLEINSDLLADVTFVKLDKSQLTSDHKKNERYAAKTLKRSHIFLQPYRKLESAIDAPLLLYEAQAAGCYIFSRNVPGIEGHTTENCWLYHGDDASYPEEASKMIEKVYSNWQKTSSVKN